MSYAWVRVFVGGGPKFLVSRLGSLVGRVSRECPTDPPKFRDTCGDGPLILHICRAYILFARNGLHTVARVPSVSHIKWQLDDPPRPHFQTHQWKILLDFGAGDGTVMWVVSEAQKHGVHTETGIRIGMVPLGTGAIRCDACAIAFSAVQSGNDFSQALGWGGRTQIPRGIAWLIDSACRNPDADALLKNDCAGMRDLMQPGFSLSNVQTCMWRPW